jgi:hypothetical protein
MSLHVIRNPAGTYSYVGTVPAALGVEAPATRADVMGGRSYFNANRETVAVRWPVFPSRAEALAHASAHGYEVASLHPNNTCDL